MTGSIKMGILGGRFGKTSDPGGISGTYRMFIFYTFANLMHDMPGEIRKIAEFIDTPIDETQWESILDHCSFNYMKANATKSVPLGGAFWDGGAQTFIHKGTNDRWREVLSVGESSKYEHCAAEELDRECAHWLATGEIP